MTIPVEPRDHIPGEAGVWVFILGDMGVFALFFGVIVFLRGQHPTMYARSQAQLHQGLGAVDTILLLTSSLLVATAVRTTRRGRPHAPKLLSGALACALGFAALKAVEYTSLIRGGHTPNVNDFYMYYFIFTGIHLAHLVLGVIVLSLLIALTRRGDLTPRQVAWVESGASYWHLVDLLWIVLFSLLYLVH